MILNGAMGLVAVDPQSDFSRQVEEQETRWPFKVLSIQGFWGKSLVEEGKLSGLVRII